MQVQCSDPDWKKVEHNSKLPTNTFVISFLQPNTLQKIKIKEKSVLHYMAANFAQTMPGKTFLNLLRFQVSR